MFLLLDIFYWKTFIKYNDCLLLTVWAIKRKSARLHFEKNYKHDFITVKLYDLLSFKPGKN